MTELASEQDELRLVYSCVPNRARTYEALKK